MFERIIVGTDGSTTAAEAVRQATELARATGAKLDIVRVGALALYLRTSVTLTERAVATAAGLATGSMTAPVGL